MRRFILAALVCSLVGLGVAIGEDSAREKEVRAVEDAFVAAWNKHDTKALAAGWAPDGDLINPFGRWAKGRAEVEKLLGEQAAHHPRADAAEGAGHERRHGTRL